MNKLIAKNSDLVGEGVPERRDPTVLLFRLFPIPLMDISIDATIRFMMPRSVPTCCSRINDTNSRYLHEKYLKYVFVLQ